MQATTTKLRRLPLRALFLALAPVALVCAGWLLPRVDVNATPWLGLDRDALLARATLAAARHGVDTGDWVPRIQVQPADDVQRFLDVHAAEAPEVVAEIRQLVPPAILQVIFEAPRNGRSGRRVTIELGPGGHELGFELVGDLPRRAGAPPDPELAWQELLERAGGGPADRWVPVEPSEPEDRDPTSGGLILTTGADSKAAPSLAVGQAFQWRWQPAELPGLSVVAYQRVAGGRLVAHRWRGHLETGVAPPAPGPRGAPASLKGLVALVLFSVSGVFLPWGLWRYWRRAREAEVSHGRTLLLAALVSTLIAAALYHALTSGIAQVDDALQQTLENPWLVLLLAVAVGLVLTPFGLLLGVVWSGSEGDAREVSPEKLLSLDALLAGRWLARQPAEAVLTAAACAIWAVAIHTLLQLVWAGQPGAGAAFDPRLTLRTHPWQFAFARGFLALVPFLPLAFLAPLSLLRRVRFVGPRRWLPGTAVVLAMICWLVPGGGAYAPVAAGLTAALVWAGAFVVPYALFDLLTAGLSFLLVPFVLELLRLVHQPLASARETVISAAVVSVVILAAAAVVARRGRPVSEEEVRPGYARNMLERMALSAELEAARQARGRLLPRQPPLLPGTRVDVAAAEGWRTDGDYHDFFPGTDGRLGWVVADFGNQGLGAALGTTLAKGFLMSYSERGLSPEEVVLRLDRRLGDLIADQRPAALVYGLYDPATGHLDLALGRPAPLVLLWRRGALLPGALPPAPPGRRVDPRPLTLAAGDALLVLTFDRPPVGRAHRRLRAALSGSPPATAADLLAALEGRGLAPGTAMMLRRDEVPPPDAGETGS